MADSKLSLFDDVRQPEEWRPVVGYEDHYEISNRGEVRRTSPVGTNTYVGKVIKPWTCIRGRRHVKLSKNDRSKSHQVHRLVALAFIGPPPSSDRKTIDHINGDPTDNRPENLEWVTHGENIRRAHRKKLIPPGTERKTKITDVGAKAIAHLRMNGVPPKLLAEAFGVHHDTIINICKRAA